MKLVFGVNVVIMSSVLSRLYHGCLLPDLFDVCSCQTCFACFIYRVCYYIV